MKLTFAGHLLTANCNLFNNIFIKPFPCFAFTQADFLLVLSYLPLHSIYVKSSTRNADILKVFIIEEYNFTLILVINVFSAAFLYLRKVIFLC